MHPLQTHQFLFKIFRKKFLKGPLEVGDSCAYQMDPLPRGGTHITYQASLDDPNTFQPDEDTTINETVEAVLYWQSIPTNFQSPKILIHCHFSAFRMYELQLLNNEKHNLHYWYNLMLGTKDHQRQYLLEYAICELSLSGFDFNSENKVQCTLEDQHHKLNYSIQFAHIICSFVAEQCRKSFMD